MVVVVVMYSSNIQLSTNAESCGLFFVTEFNDCLLFEEDNDWVKKYMEYEVERARQRNRPKKTWREIVEKDC